MLFDFGGVILSSPFEAFAAYEEANGLPKDFIRTLNATNPDDNAWAKMERNDVSIDEFCRLFEEEARAAGHGLNAYDVLAGLRGQLRPQMVEALRRCSEQFKTGLLTNNFVDEDADPEQSPMAAMLPYFDAVVESAKAGCRKPEPRFYETACELLDVHPTECVFLDDLGINLKPAKKMGMTTIKVTDPDKAIKELEAVVGIELG